MDNNTQQQLLNEILQLKHLMKRVKNITKTNEMDYINGKHYIKSIICSYRSITQIIIIALCILYPNLDKKQMLYLINKCLPINSYTLFLQYLTENGVVDKFKTNLAKSTYDYPKNKTIEGLVTSLYPQDYFNCFAWSLTIEGYDFWKQHYDRWIYKIEQMSYDYQDIFNALQKLEIK